VEGKNDMKRIARIVLAAMLVLAMGAALTGCAGVSEETKAAAGIYKLDSITVNGQTITVEDYKAATGDDILSTFTLELTEAGKYTMAYAEDDGSGGIKEGTENGDVSVSGTEISFKLGIFAPATVGSIQNGTVTIEVDGTKLVYKK
jgi:hypothetical protein